ncbi:MAG: DUF2723 domain-containing protein [Chloroflexi bacterium]|nr:DUF2723 domain-containing protein [Chloroflexota bacterium]
MKEFFKSRDVRIAALIALATQLLYVLTLAPDIVDGDGGEFQFAAWNFSFVHPTGYPLYLILGGLFQHLIFWIGTPAYWLNFFTALSGALAVGLLFLAVTMLTDARGAAILAAAAFAVSREFWHAAGAAEVYALHAFFVAALIWLALRWQANPNVDRFAGFCFACSFALTHHRTIILWLPAFALFFVLAARTGVGTRTRRYATTVPHASRVTYHVLRNTLFLLIPLLLYLYIPLRAPASPYATLTLAPEQRLVLYDNSVNGFMDYVLGRTFQAELRWDAVSVARLAAFPQMLADQFTLIGVAIGVIGLLAMVWRKDWTRFGLLFLGALANLVFAAAYHIGDIAPYYIPVYLVWAIWIGVGLEALFQVIGSLVMDHASRNTKYGLRVAYCVLLAATFFLLPYSQLAANFSFADRSNETNARGSWLRYLDTPVPPNAILISNDRDEMTPLWYLQYVEQRRRDVTGLFPLVTPAPEYANVGRLIDQVIGLGRNVYLIKPMPGIEAKFWIEAENKLYRVVGRTRETPPQNPVDARLADSMTVTGYDVIRQSDLLRVAVYWQARTKPDQNYTAFVQLFNERGEKIAQAVDHPVGGEFYPSRLWDAGEIVRDEHALILPAGFAPGTYRLRVGMYNSADRELLGAPVEISAVQVK